MKKVRLTPKSRLESYPVDDDLTLRRNWTTVTEEQARALVGLRYKDAPLVEFDEAPVDEPEVEDAEVTVFDADQEDESNGTQ